MSKAAFSAFHAICWGSLILSYSMVSNSQSLQAAEGALPKGVVEKKQDQEPPKPDIFDVDCKTYLSNPSSGEFNFSDDSRYVYFFSKSSGESLQIDAKSYLYEVDLLEKRSRRIVGLRLEGQSVILGQGKVFDAGTVFDFGRNRSGCGQGYASGTGIIWNKTQKIVKTYANSQYKLVPTDHGLQIADLKSKSVQGFDFPSMQRRRLADLVPGLIPLYVQMYPPRAFMIDPIKSELFRFDKGEKTPQSSLILKVGAKFVQDRSSFGLVEQSADKQRLAVRYLKDWSGDAFRTVSLDLPPNWKTENPRVDFLFDSEIALVQAGDIQSLRGSPTAATRSVLLYTRGFSNKATLLNPADDSYFAVSQVSPDAKYVLLLSRALSDDGAKTLKIWSIAEAKWLEDIPLMRESAPKDTTQPIKKS